VLEALARLLSDLESGKLAAECTCCQSKDNYPRGPLQVSFATCQCAGCGLCQCLSTSLGITQSLVSKMGPPSCLGLGKADLVSRAK